MKSRWWLLLSLYVALVAIGTLAIRGRSALEWVYLLIPSGMLQERLVYLLQHHHPVTFSRIWYGFDVVVNIVLFIPVGLALALLLQPRVSWDIRVLLVLALGIGVLLGLSIELLQAYVPQRIPSLADVMRNAAGSVLGCYFPYFWNQCKSRQL